MLHISPRAEEIFFVGGLPITNALILTLVVFVLLSVISLVFRRKLALVPGRIQNVIEFILDGVLDLMEPLYGNKKKAEKYLPWIATFFVLILFSNWLGLVPGVGSIGIKHGETLTPLLRAPAKIGRAHV